MNKNQRQMLLLFSAVLLVFFVFLGISYLILNSSGIFNTSRSTEPVALEEHPDYVEPEKYTEIYDLMDKVPYRGAYSSLTFDENEGVYFVYIDPEHENEGNAEINEFLNQNGFDNIQQLHFLQKSNIPVPTQTP